MKKKKLVKLVDKLYFQARHPNLDPGDNRLSKKEFSYLEGRLKKNARRGPGTIPDPDSSSDALHATSFSGRHSGTKE